MADLFKVRSLAVKGHWRSGRYWGPEWEDVPVEGVTDAMLADPRIEVECVEYVLDAAIAASGVKADVLMNAAAVECGGVTRARAAERRGGKHDVE